MVAGHKSEVKFTADHNFASTCLIVHCYNYILVFSIYFYFVK